MEDKDFQPVAAAAQILLGGEWHRELARVLGPHHPDGPRASIDPRLVRRWAAGERAVPNWVPAALTVMLREHASYVLSAADALERHKD